MLDWKTVSSISKIHFGSSKCFYPYEDLRAKDVTAFTIQLNLYAYILNKYYNIDISEMVAIAIDDVKFEEVHIEKMDIQKGLNFYLDNNLFYEQILNWQTNKTF